MAFYNNVIAGAAGAGGSDAGFEIKRSLRFDQTTTAHLNRTPSASGNKKKWTWSGWVKRCQNGNRDGLFEAEANGIYTLLRIRDDNDRISLDQSGGDNFYVYTDAVFRDNAAWYHIVCAVDTTQSTDSNRVKIYVNGIKQTLTAGTNWPAQDQDTRFNDSSYAMRVGGVNGGTQFDGYMAEVHYLDGVTPGTSTDDVSGSVTGIPNAEYLTDFGEFDADIGVWNPIEYTGAYNGAGVGQVYSGMLTSSSGFGPTNTAAEAFDGNLSTKASTVHNTDNYLEFTPTTPIAFTNGVQVHCYAPNGYSITNYWSVDLDGNGLGGETSFVGGGSNYNGPAWIDVATGSGTLYKLRIRLVRSGSNAGAAIHAIAINGSGSSSNYLVDGTPGGSSGFHLDFSDNSSNAALGTDSSGIGNTYTVNNITASGLGDTPGVTTQKGQDVTGDWSGILGVTPTNTSGAFATVPDGGGSSQPDKGKFYWSGLTVGNTITVYGTGSGQNRTVTGDVSEASSPGYVAVPGASLGSFTVTVTAASGSCKVDHNGAFTCYGITPGPLASRYFDDGIDSPSNYVASSGNNGGNYATLNPLNKGSAIALSNGNLVHTSTASNVWQDSYSFSTIGVTSGKWYAESIITNVGNNDTYVGVVGDPEAPYGNTSLGYQAHGWGYYSQGSIFWQGGTSQSAASFTTGDIIGVALDLDNLTVKFYKNGSLVGTRTALTSGKTYFFAANSYNNCTQNWNFGQRPFSISSVPTGHKSLCTQNLDNPLISDPSTAFDILAYTGTGSGTTHSGLNHTPDFIWTKSRSLAELHLVQDTVRGVGKNLYPHLTNSEDTAGYVSSFTSDGFTVPGGASLNNQLNATYVAWAWDGGDLATNSVYNQDAVWSNSSVSGTLDSSYPLSNAFNGLISGNDTRSSGTNTTITITLPQAVSFSSQIRLRVNANGTAKINNESTVSTSSGGANWVTVYSGSGSLASVTLTSTGGDTVSLYAIEVDGKQLVDAGLIFVGSLNSSTYDQSRTWSGDVSGTQYSASYPATNGFDNDLSTRAGGDFTFTPPNPIACTKVRIYMTTYAAPSNTIYLNGVDISSEIPVTNGYAVPLEFTPSNNQFVSYQCGNAGNEPGWFAKIELKINGNWVALIDSGVTVDSVPSIASTVRANPSAGFSIVSYTGVGNTASTVGHGLGAAAQLPQFILIKNRTDADDWAVYHASITNDYYLTLNSSGAQSNSVNMWNDTTPTSTVFSLGAASGSDAVNRVNNSSKNYVAYCFAPVEGYSAFGSYTGNGSDDGVFVHTNFAVRYLLTKPSSAGGDWLIWDAERDPINPNSTTFTADTNAAENTSGYDVDFLSNGFKWRQYGSSANGSGVTYIYAAFAEHPFKYARAR